MADGSASHGVPDIVRPGAKPPSGGVSSAWVETVAGPLWTVATVRAAIDDLENGRFRTAAALAEAAGRDCTIFGALGIRVRALASRYSLPFTVEAGNGDGRRREQIRRRVEELWWTTCPESVVDPILRDSVMLGVSVGMIWWERSLSEWIPHLRRLPPHGLEYREWENAWYYTTRDGDCLRVTPGDGRWFLHLPHGERSFTWGAIRALGEPWIEARFARRDRARWCERHGLSVLAVDEPFSASDDVEGEDGSDGAGPDEVYSRICRGMVSGAVIRLPQGQEKDTGWRVKWHGAEGTGFEGIESALAACGRDSEIALLGRASDAGAKGGDGELQSETVKNEFLSSDAEPLTTTIREHVWKPFVAFNHSPDDLANAPWGKYDTKTSQARQQRADLLGKIGDAIPKLKAAGVKTEAVIEEFGLEVDPSATAQTSTPKPAQQEADAA